MQVKIVVIGVTILLLGLGLYYFQNYEVLIDKKSDSKYILQYKHDSTKKHLNEGNLIKINFQVKSNKTINFFIVDSNSHRIFEKNQTKINYFAYERKDGVSSGEVKFKVKYEGDWYVVFQHSNKTNESVSIAYTIEYTSLLSEHWLLSIFFQLYIFIIAIGVFVLIGGFFERKEEVVKEIKKKEIKEEIKPKKGFYIETECSVCNSSIKEGEKTYICKCGYIIHENCAKKVGKCLSCGRIIR